jgi:hypothetical protein
MILTGRFTLLNGECRLQGGALLADCSDSSPLDAARPFLLGRGCQPGGFIQVTGTPGQSGSVAVFCMSGAQPIAAPAAESLVANAKLSKPRSTKPKRPKQRPTKAKKPASGKPKTRARKAKTTRRKRSK